MHNRANVIHMLHGTRLALVQMAIVVLTVGCRPQAQVEPVFPVVLDESDHQVLEAFLLHLRTDRHFNLTRVSTNEATVVLDWRTPEKTGCLNEQQMTQDTPGHALPKELGHALRRRNTEPTARPGEYTAVTAFYTNLSLTAGIVVADLTGRTGLRGLMGAFAEAHPEALGWVEAYLPGYSVGGELAVVRAHIGPTSHGAMVTALLERHGNRWQVVWHRIAFYL
jgi:hypothetical protein